MQPCLQLHKVNCLLVEAGLDVRHISEQRLLLECVNDGQTGFLQSTTHKNVLQFTIQYGFGSDSHNIQKVNTGTGERKEVDLHSASLRNTSLKCSG